MFRLGYVNGKSKELSAGIPLTHGCVALRRRMSVDSSQVMISEGLAASVSGCINVCILGPDRTDMRVSPRVIAPNPTGLSIAAAQPQLPYGFGE